MNRITEEDLMRGYSKEPVRPIPVPEPVEPRTRLCHRGHTAIVGEKCDECLKMDRVELSAKRTGCDRGHPWTTESVRIEERHRADGTPYKARVCLVCEAEREKIRLERKAARDAAKEPTDKGRVSARQVAISRVIAIDEAILGMVDKIELMSRFELATWRAERDKLTEERDALARRFSIA